MGVANDNCCYCFGTDSPTITPAPTTSAAPTDGGSPLPADTTANEHHSTQHRDPQFVDTTLPSPAQTADPTASHAQPNHPTPEVPSTGGELFSSAPVKRTPIPTFMPSTTSYTGCCSTLNWVNSWGAGCDWYEEEDLPVSTSYSPELFVYVDRHW